MQNSDKRQLIGKKFLSSKEPRVVNYYIAIAVDIILLYFFNNIVFANIFFLSAKDLTNCLWAINLALGIGIIGNFIFLLYRPRWFRHLVQAVLNALAVLAVYVIFRVFPFTFTDDVWRTVARIIMIIIMVGAGIGFVVEVVKSGIAWLHREPPFAPTATPVSPSEAGPPASSLPAEEPPPPPPPSEPEPSASSLPPESASGPPPSPGSSSQPEPPSESPDSSLPPGPPRPD